MNVRMNRLLIAFSASAAIVTLPMFPSLAAGPYDGTWQVDAAPAGNSGTNTTGSAQCEGIRVQFQVKDNQVQGSLARSPYGGNRVSQTGRGATPITGTVQPDGTINAQWQGNKATGKLTADNKAELRWKGQCGPRVATGTRVASDGAAGSSTR